MPNLLSPYACLNCRKVFKRLGPVGDRKPCPNCGAESVCLCYKFKAPKSSDIEQWQKVQMLIENGFLFQSIYNEHDGGTIVPYPTPLRETPDWIQKWSVSKTDATIDSRR
jgi:hypothetical protein